MGKKAGSIRGRSPILAVREGFSVFFDRFFSYSRQRFTVMFIPHSERRVMNFQINTLMIVVAALLVALVIAGFFVITTISSGAARMASQKSADLVETNKTLDSMLSQVSELSKSASVFDSALTDTLHELDIKPPTAPSPAGSSGDLAGVLNAQEINPNDVQQLQTLKNLTASLGAAVAPLTQISGAIQSEKQFLSDIPNYWPIAGGRGTITMNWGPNRHPITGEWFLNKGIEIWESVGTPVVASANGKVVEAGWDSNGYGFYVKLDHKYGFKTRYSHLSRIEVSEGEEVLQGQTIGRVGKSGETAEPGLDFQIQLGTEFLDPTKFLKIRDTSDRWTTNPQ